jgi:hypothetical protein
MLMIAGVSMFGCLSGLAAAFFLGTQPRRGSEDKDILDKLSQLEKKLDALAGHLLRPQ